MAAATQQRLWSTSRGRLRGLDRNARWVQGPFSIPNPKALKGFTRLASFVPRGQPPASASRGRSQSGLARTPTSSRVVGNTLVAPKHRRNPPPSPDEVRNYY